jgi:hypothetical protein
MHFSRSGIPYNFALYLLTFTFYQEAVELQRKKMFMGFDKLTLQITFKEQSLGSNRPTVWLRGDEKMNSLLSFRCESQKEINNQARVQRKHSRSGNNSELDRMRAVLAVYTRVRSDIRVLSLSFAQRGSAWVRSGKNCHVLCLNKSASVKFPL